MISKPLLHKMKILVVDDDRMTVTLLEQLLQSRISRKIPARSSKA